MSEQKGTPLTISMSKQRLISRLEVRASHELIPKQRNFLGSSTPSVLGYMRVQLRGCNQQIIKGQFVEIDLRHNAFESLLV